MDYYWALKKDDSKKDDKASGTFFSLSFSFSLSLSLCLSPSFYLFLFSLSFTTCFLLLEKETVVSVAVKW
jgi:hypothetical protein